MDDVLSVSAITNYIDRLFKSDDQLRRVWVEGEISSAKRYSSGHFYFTLKDNKAQINGVMWNGIIIRNRTRLPQAGDKVMVQGKIEIYPDRGTYQLYANLIQQAGVGDLHAQFEALKQQLFAEGLFDEIHKSHLPTMPKRIGVVTSAQAAAYQDVLNILRRRYPLAEVVLSHTLVQGDSAPPQIIRAIQKLDRAGVDVILLVRGGGSMEDLWAFNDERLARAIFDAQTPIVSGVGHEIDFTIADFVADHRAPTPSAAAEIVTPDINNLRQNLTNQRNSLHQRMTDNVQQQREMLAQGRRTLGYLSPQNRIQNHRQQLDERRSRLNQAIHQRHQQTRERLQNRQQALHQASPQSIMERGYAVITDKTGHVISSQTDATPQTPITIIFQDGKRKAIIEE